MRRAALIGNGWFPYMYSPRRYAASVATIRATAADTGRDLAGFEWCVWVFLNINPDGDTARKEAARTMGGTYNQDFRAMIERRRRGHRSRGEGQAAKLLRRGCTPLRLPTSHRGRRPAARA